MITLFIDYFSSKKVFLLIYYKDYKDSLNK